nr:receptor-like kinase TMK4 [Ipomoea batatas]
MTTGTVTLAGLVGRLNRQIEVVAAASAIPSPSSYLTKGIEGKEEETNFPRFSCKQSTQTNNKLWGMALLNMVADLGFPLTLVESWFVNDPCRKWRFISCDVQGEVTTVDLENQHFRLDIGELGRSASATNSWRV